MVTPVDSMIRCLPMFSRKRLSPAWRTPKSLFGYTPSTEERPKNRLEAEFIIFFVKKNQFGSLAQLFFPKGRRLFSPPSRKKMSNNFFCQEVALAGRFRGRKLFVGWKLRVFFGSVGVKFLDKIFGRVFRFFVCVFFSFPKQSWPLLLKHEKPS